MYESVRQNVIWYNTVYIHLWFRLVIMINDKNYCVINKTDVGILNKNLKRLWNLISSFHFIFSWDLYASVLYVAPVILYLPFYLPYRNNSPSN